MEPGITQREGKLADNYRDECSDHVDQNNSVELQGQLGRGYSLDIVKKVMNPILFDSMIVSDPKCRGVEPTTKEGISKENQII